MNTRLHRGRTTAWVLALAAACSAAITAAAALSASGSAQTQSGRTITMFESRAGSTFGFVDNPPKTTRAHPRLSVGDLEAFSNPVFDASHTQRLGTSASQCIVTRPGSLNTATATCVGTFALKDGTISVAAQIRGEPNTIVLAVTGGTGAYNGARGTMTSRLGRRGSTDTFALLP